MCLTMTFTRNCVTHQSSFTFAAPLWNQSRLAQCQNIMLKTGKMQHFKYSCTADYELLTLCQQTALKALKNESCLLGRMAQNLQWFFQSNIFSVFFIWLSHNTWMIKLMLPAILEEIKCLPFALNALEVRTLNWMVLCLYRSKCWGWNTSAEWKGLSQSQFLWHEGSIFSSISGFDSQHSAFCGPPSAVLPASAPLWCSRWSVHGYLFPESRWKWPFLIRTNPLLPNTKYFW